MKHWTTKAIKWIDKHLYSMYHVMLSSDATAYRFFLWIIIIVLWFVTFPIKFIFKTILYIIDSNKKK